MSENFQALTFGLEFEFALAYVPTATTNPYPSDRRVVEFKPITADKEDAKAAQEIYYGGGFEVEEEELDKEAVKFAIYRHIKNTLRNAGYSVNSDLHYSSSNEWSVIDDSSIKSPETSFGYEFAGVELVSPAYYFCPDSMKAVEDVLALMTSKYVINVNETTGLHVHIGNGERGFTFNTLRKLVSFLFAFTPQLNTLHPPHRQADNEYIGSLREHSRFEARRRPAHKVRPTAIHGIVRCLTSEDPVELFRYMQNALSTSKWMAYNFASVERLALGRSDRPTIEFRQHEGCVEATAVLNWLKTVVSIIDFSTNASASSVHELLNVINLETWEKRGDGLDRRRKREHGPALADRDFTVIHLLRALKRWGPALYYRKRGIYNLKVVDALYRESEETEMWDYEANPPKDPVAGRLGLQVALRETWDALHVVTKVRAFLKHPSPEYYTFDRADSTLWPAHNSILDDNKDTDATLPPPTPISGSTTSVKTPSPSMFYDDEDEDDEAAEDATGNDEEESEASDPAQCASDSPDPTKTEGDKGDGPSETNHDGEKNSSHDSES